MSQDVTWRDKDDSVHRTLSFFTGQTEGEVKSKLIEAYNEAMLDLPNVIRIEQKMLKRTDRCPCGSNEIFERCCMWKICAEPPVPITPNNDEDENGNGDT